jgi:hypothetical protein
VSYFSLPHVRRVTSPSWVVDRRHLRCLCRRSRHDARPGLVTAPACAAPSRAALAEAGLTSRAAHTDHAPCGRGPRTRCARGLSRCREHGSCVHCTSRPSVVSAQWQLI